jgi:hypothetical protein
MMRRRLGQNRRMIQAVIVLLSLFLVAIGRQRRRRRLPATAVIVSPRRSTVIARDGAVRSVQSAELSISHADLDRLWNATNLENLARTYWRFLSRVTLGLIRVTYGDNERSVVLLGRPLTLLRFEAPEYDIQRDYGIVRWRIRDGLLVARAGCDSGFLSIEVRRLNPGAVQTEVAKLGIEVEVANFYPAIAAGLSMPVYELTQSFVHVLVTHGFLRSLAKLDLAQSKVGRLAVAEPDGAQPDAQEPGGAGDTPASPFSRSARP